MKFKGVVIHENDFIFIISLSCTDLFVDVTKLGLCKNRPKIGDLVEAEGEYDEKDEILEDLLIASAIKILSSGKKICSSRLRKTYDRERKLCKDFETNKVCRNRFCQYRHFFLSKHEEHEVKTHRSHEEFLLKAERDINDPHLESEKKDMCCRAKVFAKFLLQTYSKKYLQSGGVLDVGGRYGNLSFILNNQYDINCTIIDPFELDHINEKKEKHYKRIQKIFNVDFAKNNEELIKGCSLIVGLHPDEATEEIIDVAIKYKKNCCFVPCCLISKYEWITEYDDWTGYMMKILIGSKMDFLKLKGRNKVIYQDKGVN